MTHTTHRWSLVLALTLVLAASVAAPAAAKGPILYPSKCVSSEGEIRAACQREGKLPPGQASGGDGPDAGIVAGIAGGLMLLLAGGMLVAANRPDAQPSGNPELRRRFS